MVTQPETGACCDICDERVVGDLTYDPLPVQLFATVNIGWELEL